MRRKVKRILIFLAILGACFLLGTQILYSYVSAISNPYIYADAESVPYNKVGLLLGTSKYLPHGYINSYYQNRINAAVHLYDCGKIACVLVSGDNRSEYYNEPLTIKKDLIAAGIPAHKIFLDNYGVRTFESINRCSQVFGQASFTIISQHAHNQRAVYIAQRMHLDAIAFDAKDVPLQDRFNQLVREHLARIKMFLDFIENKDSKESEEKIIIP